MELKELYEVLTLLMNEGKGHYLVSIECLDGYSERVNTIHIDDEHQDIEIVGA